MRPSQVHPHQTAVGDAFLYGAVIVHREGGADMLKEKDKQRLLQKKKTSEIELHRRVRFKSKV